MKLLFLYRLINLPQLFTLQSVPLDFDTDDFYTNRKDLIDKRVEDIRIWSFEELSSIVENVWSSWANTVTSCPANWDLFPLGIHQLLGLLKCFHGYQLSGICERLAKVRCWATQLKHMRWDEGFLCIKI